MGKVDKALSNIGTLLYTFRGVMSLFYVGLVIIMMVILYQFFLELVIMITKVPTLSKMDLIIKVLELVDMTMVAQLVWVVALAGFSLFVSSAHFDNKNVSKPDWLDHVNTYNLKLKLAFAIISISGVHTLKTFLQGAVSEREMFTLILGHIVFVLCAVGIAFAERLTRDNDK